MVMTVSDSQTRNAKLLRQLRHYSLALSPLLIAALLTIVFTRNPSLQPLVGLSYVLAVAVAAWLGGFWAGILAAAVSIPMAEMIATGGNSFLPQRLDAPTLGAMFLIALLSSRVAAMRRHVEELLRASNKELELRVAERTADLVQARESLRITLASIGDAVIATDVAGRVTLVNDVAQRLTGWTQEEALGRPLAEVFVIINEDTRSEVENPAMKVLRLGTSVGLANHTLLVSRDGREIPIDDSGAPIKDDAGHVSGVVLVFRDVTERRRTQRELAESERRYRLLFEDNPQPMWVFDDRSLAFLEVNDAAVQSYGYSREEFFGMTLKDIRPAEDVPALLEDIHSGKGNFHTDGPWRHRRKDGSIFLVEIITHPLQSFDQHARLVLARDVTERKKLEELLRQTQKMEAIGRLAAGTAHDFNNLLTIILTYASTALNQLDPQEPLHKTMSEILRAGERGAELTGQLLTFSRKQVTQFRIIDLNAHIKANTQMLRRLVGEDVDLCVFLDPTLAPVKADSACLTQILMNLAANARDAMPSGGKLTVETHNITREEEDLGRRGVRPAGNYVVLAVTDEGQGMDRETQEHLFEPFFTTKEVGKGTGLGLATVHGIVEQHGGWIDLYSELGHGTSFKICLPASDDGVIAVREEMHRITPRRSATILLVEDEAAIRLGAEDFLSEAGYIVLSAGSGQEALRLLDKQPRTVDVLVTDVVMPGMNGPELAERLLGLQPKISVVYMSGYTDHALLRRGMIEQGTAFLPKPFLPRMLLAKIDELLS